MVQARRCLGILAATCLISGLAQTCLAGAKNVIICIADGGGFNAYNSTSLYQYGRLGCQPYDQPGWVKYASRTYSLTTKGKIASRTDDLNVTNAGELIHTSVNGSFDPAIMWDSRVDVMNTLSLSTGTNFKGYILLKSSPTDSAASATAMASGQKAINGRLNYVPDSFSDNEIPLKGKSIAEIAKAMGKATGVITTVQWNDATPAGLGGAHNLGRGSRRDISNEMLTSGTLDVIMGAGHPEYDRYGAPVSPARDSDYDIAGGIETWRLLKTGTHVRGWKMIETKAQFEALAAGSVPTGRVFGLLRNINTVQQERRTRDWNGDGKVDAADMRVAPPFKDPFIPTTPSLVTMTRGAINVLSKNPKGFYLMVEGGAVDHAAHANQPGRLIEEQIDFNNSIQAIVEWVNKNSNWDETLVVVSADHETGLLWGSNSDREAFDRMMPRGIGRAPGMWFNTGGHSNSLVPLRARGPGASLFASRVQGCDPVWGEWVENTTIFDVMNAAMSGATVLEPVASTDSTDLMTPSYPSTTTDTGSTTKTTDKKKPSRSSRKGSGDKKSGDKTDKNSSDKTSTDKSGSDKTPSEKSSSDKSGSDKTSSDKSASDKTTTDKASKTETKD